MPESATASPPSSQDFQPIPVQQDRSEGSAPPIVPGATSKEINVGKESGGTKDGKAGSGMDSAFSDLDRLFSDTESKPGKALEDGKAGKREDETAKDEKPLQDDPGAKEEGSGEKSEQQNGNKAVSAPELRKAYEKLKAEVTTLREQIKSKGPSEDDLNTWKGQYETELKKRTELEKELAQSAYERSTEFNEKYHIPFQQSYQKAREKISRYKLTDAEGNSRQASGDDFDAIMQVTDDNEAAALARELFGDTIGPIVITKRDEIKDLHENMQEALKNAETNFQKSQGEKKIQTERQQAHLNKLWKTLNDGAAEKYPQYFKPVEGDEKGNELLQKGYELVDKVFMDGSQLDPEEAIKLHSQVRNRAAAFGRLAHINRNLETKVKELEKELKSFKESVPGNGYGKAGKKTEGESWEQALDRYASK